MFVKKSLQNKGYSDDVIEDKKSTISEKLTEIYKIAHSPEKDLLLQGNYTPDVLLSSIVMFSKDIVQKPKEQEKGDGNNKWQNKMVLGDKGGRILG